MNNESWGKVTIFLLIGLAILVLVTNILFRIHERRFDDEVVQRYLFIYNKGKFLENKMPILIHQNSFSIYLVSVLSFLIRDINILIFLIGMVFTSLFLFSIYKFVSLFTRKNKNKFFIILSLFFLYGPFLTWSSGNLTLLESFRTFWLYSLLNQTFFFLTIYFGINYLKNNRLKNLLIGLFCFFLCVDAHIVGAIQVPLVLFIYALSFKIKLKKSFPFFLGGFIIITLMFSLPFFSSKNSLDFIIGKNSCCSFNLNITSVSILILILGITFLSYFLIKKVKILKKPLNKKVVLFVVISLYLLSLFGELNTAHGAEISTIKESPWGESLNKINLVTNSKQNNDLDLEDIFGFVGVNFFEKMSKLIVIIPYFSFFLVFLFYLCIKEKNKFLKNWALITMVLFIGFGVWFKYFVNVSCDMEENLPKYWYRELKISINARTLFFLSIIPMQIELANKLNKKFLIILIIFGMIIQSIVSMNILSKTPNLFEYFKEKQNFFEKEWRIATQTREGTILTSMEFNANPISRNLAAFKMYLESPDKEKFKDKLINFLKIKNEIYSFLTEPNLKKLSKLKDNNFTHILIRKNNYQGPYLEEEDFKVNISIIKEFLNNMVYEDNEYILFSI